MTNTSTKGLLPQLVDVLQALAGSQQMLTQKVRNAHLECVGTAPAVTYPVQHPAPVEGAAIPATPVPDSPPVVLRCRVGYPNRLGWHWPRVSLERRDAARPGGTRGRLDRPGRCCSLLSHALAQRVEARGDRRRSGKSELQLLRRPRRRGWPVSNIRRQERSRTDRRRRLAQFSTLTPLTYQPPEACETNTS